MTPLHTKSLPRFFTTCGRTITPDQNFVVTQSMISRPRLTGGCKSPRELTGVRGRAHAAALTVPKLQLRSIGRKTCPASGAFPLLNLHQQRALIHLLPFRAVEFGNGSVIWRHQAVLHLHCFER